MERRLVATVLLFLFCTSLLVAQAKPQRVRVPDSVMQGMVVTKVPPAYPPDAKRAHIQGTVILQIIVSKTGDVENIQLISGHPMLAPAAIDAVKQWKYRPYSLNGVPVEVDTKVTVNFTLSDTPADGVAGDAPGGLAPGQPGSVSDSSSAPATPLIAIPQRVRVSKGVMEGLVVKKVPPMYPEDARHQHIEGTVTLKATIDKQGTVANLQLISGDPMLVPAAIEAVRQWKYRPYLLNQMPVEVETQVQINFTLSK